MNRRGFLQTILAAAATPAIVKAESLMKVVTPSGLLMPDLAIAPLFGSQYEDTILRSMADALGLSYEVFTKDLTQFTYSSSHEALRLILPQGVLQS